MRRIGYALTAMACAVAAIGPAQALPLQSWDTKIAGQRRFVVLKAFDDRAVLDRETQLVWQRAPGGPLLRSFSGAFNSCYASEIGGRLGWRVPTMPELTSLLDRSQSFPPLPAGHPFDVSALSRDVWTASTLPGTNEAFTQDMRNDGFLGSTQKTTELNVWCVRGGTGVEGQ
jgi:Protein of unknown function (DUF1566)